MRANKNVVISQKFIDKLAPWIANTYKSTEGKQYMFQYTKHVEDYQDLKNIMESATSEEAWYALQRYMKTIQHKATKN